VFGIIVQTRFSATHQLRLPDGSLEPLHGHDWHVRALFRAPSLDSLGMVLDFHDAEKALQATVSGWHLGHLNHLPDFAGQNPTAENIAHATYRILHKRFPSLFRIEVTEAPECVAYYESDQNSR